MTILQYNIESGGKEVCKTVGCKKFKNGEVLSIKWKPDMKIPWADKII